VTSASSAACISSCAPRRATSGYVEISDEMAQKLKTKHGVQPEEVRDACQIPNRYLRAWWDHDPQYGSRLLVIGETRAGRRLKIVLKPVDETDGTWLLRTAFEAKR
jgi:hypothetical protein